MLKAVIIDDEQSAINTLTLMMERYVPEITGIKTTTDPVKGLEIMHQFKPDLLFLDIHMPVMNGFELLKQLHPVNVNIIFTTAFNEYAIEAIKFSALDYLLKPIDADELRAAIDKFMIREVITMSQKALYSNLMHNLTVSNVKDFKLALPTLEGTYFFNPDEIIRLEGESNYTNFHFTNRKHLLISRTLKEYEELLQAHGFIRTHKSHLVNKKHVVNYTSDGILTMKDTSRVEISRRRKEDVIEALKLR